MGLEWVVLGTAVAFEAVFVLLLTLPTPKPLRKTVVSLTKAVLKPALAVIPFAMFQLLDVYWKYEHRIKCDSEVCSVMERDRFEKSTYKGERNAILALTAAFLYWVMYRYVQYVDEVQYLETEVRRLKEE